MKPPKTHRTIQGSGFARRTRHYWTLSGSGRLGLFIPLCLMVLAGGFLAAQILPVGQSSLESANRLNQHASYPAAEQDNLNEVATALKSPTADKPAASPSVTDQSKVRLPAANELAKDVTEKTCASAHQALAAARSQADRALENTLHQVQLNTIDKAYSGLLGHASRFLSHNTYQEKIDHENQRHSERLAQIDSTYDNKLSQANCL